MDGYQVKPFMRTPQQVQDLIDKTEGNLRELDR